MRYAVLPMLLVLSGCSLEWGLRSKGVPGAVDSDTGETWPDDPSGPGSPDTGSPDDDGPEPPLPDHCQPARNPPIMPVWYGEQEVTLPGHPADRSIDFDAQGRLLWLHDGDLHWADRGGSHGILDPEWDHPFRGSVKVLPNGGVVVSSQGQLTVRDPDAGETLLRIEENLGSRLRELDGIEVDTHGYFYTEYGSDAIFRIRTSPGLAEEVLESGWRTVEDQEDFLRFALTPDEKILYILEFEKEGPGNHYRAGLYRAERHGGNWEIPEFVLRLSPGDYNMGDLVVDECGNAIVLLGWGGPHTGHRRTELWYVPLGEYDAKRIAVKSGLGAGRIQWGTGRFGWEATTLYMWAWETSANEARLYRIPMGVKGNHVLTR